MWCCTYVCMRNVHACEVGVLEEWVVDVSSDATPIRFTVHDTQFVWGRPSSQAIVRECMCVYWMRTGAFFCPCEVTGCSVPVHIALVLVKPISSMLLRVTLFQSTSSVVGFTSRAWLQQQQDNQSVVGRSTGLGQLSTHCCLD